MVSWKIVEGSGWRDWAKRKKDSWTWARVWWCRKVGVIRGLSGNGKNTIKNKKYILVYWVIQIIQILPYFIVQHQNFLFGNVPSHPVRKAFKVWKTVMHMAMNERYPKSNACLKTQILQFSTNTTICLPDKSSSLH